MDARITELLRRLEGSESLQGCWEAILDFAAGLGFEQVIYGAMHVQRQDEAPLQFANVDPNWIPYYQDSEYFKHDILIDHLLTTLQPFEYYTDTLKDDDTLTVAQRQVIAEAADAGIRNIIAFPTRPGLNFSHGNFSYVHTGAPSEAKRAYELNGTLLALGSLYTEIYLQKFLRQAEAPLEIHFKPRQREILQLLCLGKSYKQVANELHLSERGVIYHVNSMRRQVKASTARELVSLALMYQWVSL